MKKNEIKELIPYIIIIIVVLLFRAFVADPIRVKGPSMNNTLKNGDIMILNRHGDLERGKIVVVKVSKTKIIKRIIGLPGDTLYAQNGVLYLNDEVYEEDYISSRTKDFKKVFLRDNEYFVLGDNRAISEDSSVFGPVTKDQILGTTNFTVFPFSKFGKIE